MQIIDNGNAIVKAFVDGVEFEEEAQKQVQNVASMPFIFRHVAIMPDVHWGMGATVGSVIPTKGAIIPAAVGVDIGCGMVAARTDLTANDLGDSVKSVREEIENRVPHGRTHNGRLGDRGAWHNIPSIVGNIWEQQLQKDFETIVAKHPGIAKANSINHLGSLGTGNHFIELCLDETDQVWIMLHSGSRGVGNKIGTYFIDLARKDMEKWMINLPDKNLAYLPVGTEHFSDYWEALNWAQYFAALNRRIMLSYVVESVEYVLNVDISFIEQAINCHHNYATLENHFGENVYVTRKGAVRARKGDLGIIPGSMGAKSYIVRGKGNSDSFNSCSHGAGRRLSRSKAKKLFTVEDHKLATEGVECRKDESVLDETPGAYKDIDAVMEAQKDLVDIEHTLKQVLCVKG